jgi:signal transduction histidine kinase
MNSAAHPLASRDAPFRFRPLNALRFALIVAAGFTVLNFALSAGDPAWGTAGGWLRAAAACLTISVTIQFIIALLYAFGLRLIGPRFASLVGWRIQLFRWGIPTVGLLIALPLSSWLMSLAPDADRIPAIHTTPLGGVAFGVLVMLIFYGYFAIRARQWRAERQAAQAQVRLLQAQMEPHFLFNTLANVVGLMDQDTPRAKAMLESFTDYLRASLVSLRQPVHALGSELDLIDAYLRVAKVRMDGRLHYKIDVPDELRGLQVPSLSLQPLVENALRHGLEPSIEGGRVTVSARREGNRLVIQVADDGLGLDAPGAAPQPGSGTALPNIRERLRQAHGESAGLRIERVMPHGVLATMTLPASPATP